MTKRMKELGDSGSDDVIEVEAYQVDCVRILADDPTQLNEEFIRQPSDLAYWNHRYRDALEAYLMARAEARRARVRATLVIREQAKAAAQEEEEPAPVAEPELAAEEPLSEGEKPKPKKAPKPPKPPKRRAALTVDDLKAIVEAGVEADADVLATETELIRAECEKERVRGVIDAIRAKKDMLQQLGPSWRAEMQGDPTTRDWAAMKRAQRTGG